MTAAHPINRLISNSFRTAIINRGKALFLSNKVKLLQHYGEDGVSEHYVAKVFGSTNRPYEVNLWIDDYSIDTECTCPYEYDCKHGVAAAFAIAQTKATPKPRGIDDWLLQLKNTMSFKEKPSNTGRFGLKYLIDSSRIPIRIGFKRFARLTSNNKNVENFLTTFHLEDPIFTSQDREIIELFRYRDFFNNPNGVPYFQCPQGLEAHILRTAITTARAYDSETESPLSWSDEVNELDFEWQKVNSHYKFVAQSSRHNVLDQWYIGQPPIYKKGNEFGVLSTQLPTEALSSLHEMPLITVHEKDKIDAHLAYFGLTKESDQNSKLVKIESPNIHLTLEGIYSKRTGHLPALKVEAIYGPINHLIIPHSDKPPAKPSPVELTEHQGKYYATERNTDLEHAVCSLLKSLNLIQYDYGNESGKLWVPSVFQPEHHIAQWHKILPKLRRLIEQEGWSVSLSDSYRVAEKTTQFIANASDSAPGWFELQFGLQIEGFTFASHDIIRQWLKAGTPDKLALQTQDEHWVLADMSKLQAIAQTLIELYDGDDTLQESKLKLPNFKATDFADDVLDCKAAPNLKKLRKELKDFSGIPHYPPSRLLKAELRDYQQKGLNWLNFLFRYGFGGILADDMGLGKTLQTLAFIQKLKNARKLKHNVLIVCPTSLLWNWANECERFTPNLSYCVFHGSDRHELKKILFDCDIIFTSYALVPRDADLYKDKTFTLVVLDEAQNIKNELAKTTRATKAINAQMRLALTGTPLENHLGELWSIMDFCLPGLLNNSRHFKTHYRTPIEQHRDSDANRLLSNKVTPFMLRRTKELVAKELPKKSEITQVLKLSKEQRHLYEGIRISMEKKVRQLIQEKGAAKSHIEFLDALLKLRQACIDPQLVKLKAAEKIKASAKMEWLNETLPEMVDEGRKILVFSQFTQMLTLIENTLKKQNIKYVKLTGQTRKRREVIDAFQNGVTPVFLISLKAGGAGLNLTAADTVIHVDPWWNPAVENQATDRAYRIGQDKPVFVYKLVAADTVEEKIQMLQKDKQALADQLFNEAKKTKLPRTGEELMTLLS